MATTPIYQNGELRFAAFHPSQGQYGVRVTRRKLVHWAGLGEWRLNELNVCVCKVLERPAAIFEGLRKEEDENRGPDGAGWWCYAGIPSTRFLDYGSGARKPTDNEVFLVFVTDEDVAYNIRWEKVENNVEWLRAEHPERFQRTIYPNPQKQGQKQ